MGVGRLAANDSTLFRSQMPTSALRILGELRQTLPANITEIARGRILSYQIQILARLLPDGDLKIRLQQLGKQALADGELRNIPDDIDTQLNFAIAQKNNDGTLLDALEQAVRSMKEALPAGRLGAIEGVNLTRAHQLLSQYMGQPVVRIADYVAAQRTIVLLLPAGFSYGH